MKTFNFNVVISMAIFLSSPVFAVAPVSDVTTINNTMSIENKVQELTRLLQVRNKMQVHLQSQLDEISQEMQQMKGNLELVNHKIEQIETRQRNLYQLIDEKGKPAASSVADNALPVGDVENDKVAYQKAVDLVVVNKEYEQAVVAFKAFVIAHPQSAYIANAHYWLGLVLNKQKKREEARAAFLTVSEKYPNSNKRPDSLFKIGIIDEYLKDFVSAKIFYNKVLNEFPDSSAAGLAKKRLQGL